MADIVCCTNPCQVAGPDGQIVHLFAGFYWPADDPIVLAYPEHFTDDIRYNLHSSEPLDDRDADARRQAPAEEPPVEQATAAPGEKRATRRSGV